MFSKDESAKRALLEKIREDGMNLRYVEDQTTELCMEAVRQNGWALRFVREQRPEICLEAVRQDWRTLECVQDQTDEICLEAVRQNGNALAYVNNQTDEICLEAVRQNGRALYYAEKRNPEICLSAVRQNGMALQDVPYNEQNLVIAITAIKQNAESRFYLAPAFRTAKVYEAAGYKYNARDLAHSEPDCLKNRKMNLIEYDTIGRT